MLPFAKDKKGITVIIGKMKDKMPAKSDMMTEASDSGENDYIAGMDDAMEGFLKAIDEKDPKGMTDALMAWSDCYEMCCGDAQDTED